MSREFREALILFRKRKFEESAAICTEILRKTPLDKVKFLIKNSSFILNFFPFMYLALANSEG